MIADSLLPATYQDIQVGIVALLEEARTAAALTRRFGHGFGWRNLTQMRNFHRTWPAENSCRQCLQNLMSRPGPSDSRFPGPPMFGYSRFAIPTLEPSTSGKPSSGT